MPLIQWTLPYLHKLKIPEDSQENLSFEMDSDLFVQEMIAPKPSTEGDPFEQDARYSVDIYPRVGSLAIGEYKQCFLDVDCGIAGNPLWGLSPDDPRKDKGSPITVFNAPEIATDGTTTPWSVLKGRDPEWDWYRTLTAFKLVVPSRKKVLVAVTQDTVDNASCLSYVMNGTQNPLLEIYNGSHIVSKSFTLNEGVFLLTVGPAYPGNTPNPDQEFQGTISVTFSEIPPMPVFTGSVSGTITETSDPTPNRPASRGIVYSWTPNNTGNYDVRMSGSFDTFLIITDSNSNLLNADDDSGGGLTSRIYGFTAQAGTQYLIEACGYSGGSIGPFTLTATLI